MVLKFARSFGHALQGFRTIWRTQRNFRIQIVVAILVVLVSVILRFSSLELVAVLIAISMVVIAEGFNTVIEYSMDLYKSHPDPLVCRIKDIMASVVLMASCFSVLIGLLVLWHHFVG